MPNISLSPLVETELLSAVLVDDTMTSPEPASRRHWHYVFVSIAVCGILANAGILWRRKKTAKRTSSTTKTSLFLLGTMAAADTVCLLALLFMLTLRYFHIKDPLFLNLVCKLDLFLIHTTSAFSIWCWLVLSAVRYVAVYRPYMHLRLNREPRFAVIVVAVFCCLMESWVLYDIQFDPVSQSCMSSSDESLSKKLQISEIIVSYFLPVAIITILDMKVLLCRAMWYHGHSKRQCEKDGLAMLRVNSLDEPREIPVETQNNNNGFSTLNCAIYESGKIIGGTSKMASFDDTNSLKRARSKKRLQQLKVLRRCLCITIFDLSMNLPNYLLRLYLTVISQDEYESLNMEVVGYVESVSQVMYFAQFALNALYLVCIIYDTPKRREKIPVSTQISSAYYSISPRTLSTKRSFRGKESIINNALMV